MAVDTYEAQRERNAERQARLSREGREIGTIPRIAHPGRRNGCARDFRRFCRTYQPETFKLPFCPDHLKIIAKVEQSVLRGGLFCLATPRGAGKTSLCEAAVLWAILYGHRQFVALIGADDGYAEKLLASLKLEVEVSDLLMDDFPEACYPVRCLEGVPKRGVAQLYAGERTRLSWGLDCVILATIPRAKCSGAIIRVAGITGGIRGMRHKRPDGSAVRPDLVVIDDPQTDKSAKSVTECQNRERTLAGAILGLAGPGRKIAGIMPLTVILPGDMADHVLDVQKHPEWHGERCSLLYTFPTAKGLWERYADLRKGGLRQGDRGAGATEFYRANRAAMDAGAVVAWAERFNADELSAVQNAMNLWIDDPVSFAAEYQNQPLPLVPEEPGELKADDIASRVNQCPRGTVPDGCTRLTAFVDVQADLLYWLVAGWGEDFGGSVVDYSAWPDQRRAYFQLADARPTLAAATGIATLEGSLYEGLTRLCQFLLGRDWPTASGAALRVEKCLIDSGWGMSTELVFRFCRQSAHHSLLLPSKGMGISAAMVPMSDYPRKLGERRGNNWLIPPPEPGRPRRLVYDANAHKSFVAARLRQPAGERGALLLCGDDPQAHRLLADHLTAEYRVSTTGRGRTVEEWRARPGRLDNHWLDCLVGCAVAASVLGVNPGGVPGPTRSTRQRVTLAEMRARAGR